VPQAQIDIKEAIKVVEGHMTAIYELAEKVGTLSTAALAFTVTFAKNIAPSGATGAPLLIKISWCCFLIAIIGFYLVYLARIETRKRARKAFFEPNDRVYDSVLPPWYFKVGRWLLHIGFLGGFTLLGVFGIQNF